MKIGRLSNAFLNHSTIRFNAKPKNLAQNRGLGISHLIKAITNSELTRLTIGVKPTTYALTCPIYSFHKASAIAQAYNCLKIRGVKSHNPIRE